MNAEITKAALRALRMTDEERDAAMAKCSPQLQEKLEAEMAAINWVLGSVLIWREHGAGLDVLDYLREQAEVPAGV